MNLLSDEILNKYIDGELDEELTKQVETRIKSSEAEKKNYNAFKLLHKNLSEFQADNLSTDFTSLVMSKLGKKVSVPKGQKTFVFSILSFIILICLGIIGYVVYLILNSYTPPTETIQVTETARNVSTGLISELTKMFSGKNLSIIGSVFSLGILISGYFFFERQKQARANLGA
jgi:hypothetical protein